MKWGWSKREKESRDGREEGKIEKQEDGGKEKEAEEEAADLWSHWNVIWRQKLLSACARFKVSEAWIQALPLCVCLCGKYQTNG